MSKIQYKLKCAVTEEQDQQLLHVEVRNSEFP